MNALSPASLSSSPCRSLIFQLLATVLVSGLVIGLASGCAHHRDVRPGADGTHRVVVRAADRDQAERSAISQAQHYCEQKKKSAVFLDEGTQYQGAMDENARNTVQKASRAAMFLSPPNSSGSNPVGTAGAFGAIMTSGKDYTTQMRFKCR